MQIHYHPAGRDLAADSTRFQMRFIKASPEWQLTTSLVGNAGKYDPKTGDGLQPDAKGVAEFRIPAGESAKEIKQVCRELGHVPIINPNRRPAKSIPLEPAAKVRFRERSVSERGNSRLKDAFGCRHLRVRGHAKAHLHVMCGILVLFADQLLKPWASAA